ncbi:hypothetical protein F5B21DRAFT_376679 [Xylaria acuta]|nr:hypothetical protein F5B21DRAFT_376679 [Xylaria acuta]
MPIESFPPRGSPDGPRLGPHLEYARSSCTGKAQDCNIDTSTPISRYRAGINLIGTGLPRGSIPKSSSGKRSAHLNTNAAMPISQPGAGIDFVEKTQTSNNLSTPSLGKRSSSFSVPISPYQEKDINANLCGKTPEESSGRRFSNANRATPMHNRFSDSGTLFAECLPTKERLARLRDGWTNTTSLRSRLLNCPSFNVVLLERGRLVMKSHHDLAELLQQGKLEPFLDQVLQSWPESFGELECAVDVPHLFRWHVDESQSDDGTVFLCRVAARHREQRRPLEALVSPETPDVCFYPADNMLWQIIPRVANSVLTMRTVALLEGLFAPTQNTSNLPRYGSLNDWFPIQMTTPALRSTGRLGNWFCIQINLRACIPDENRSRNKHFQRDWGISPRGVGLPLNRQTAQIPDLSQGTNTTAVEYLLSVSMVSRKKVSAKAASEMRFDIVAWVDYDTNFEEPRDWESTFPVLSRRIDIDLGLKDCGPGGEAAFQFIMVLAKSIDHWKRCWDHMLAKVDGIIIVQLQDTINRKRWNSLMSDDSLKLAEQYFTILQLLRICQNWIGETERGIENLGGELIQKYEIWRVWQQEHAQNDLSQWPLDMTNLKHNVECLRHFFGTRASPLRERIKVKKDEVASLQDALLSTSSLRETLKAKTLNLYIGVFTTVTVFFTPLGFIATLWTIPYLQSKSDEPTPKGFTESFVAVPLLTYILSGFIILYFWVKSSGRPGITDLNHRLNIRGGLSTVVLWAAGQIGAIEAIWIRSRTAILFIPNFIHDLIYRDRGDPLLI